MVSINHAPHRVPNATAEDSASSTAHNAQAVNLSPAVSTAALTNSATRHTVAEPDCSAPPNSCRPPPTSGQPPPTSGQPPPTSGQPPPTSAQPPPTSTQPPPTSAQPPPTSAQPPPTSAQPPPTSAQPPPTSAQPPPKRLAFLYFLRSVGLKIIASKLQTWTLRVKHEEAKPVVVKSRRLALAKAGVHLVPCLITIFLVGFNAGAFVNGPEISTVSRYILQIASKLHELTIVGSLAGVVGDILRYYLVHDSVSFGLLGSMFSFIGLNFFWSQEFIAEFRHAFLELVKLRVNFAAFRDPTSKYGRMAALLFLLLCCLLTALAGPASALLFLPSAAWLSTGSTEFYLAGNESQLWPQHLTRADVGPEMCLTGKVSIENDMSECLFGGFDNLPAFPIRGTAFIRDADIPRNLWLWRPTPEWSETDSWASGVHLATALIANALNDMHDTAWQFAKRRRRRLRDAVNGYYIRINGPIPVARVLCSPYQPLNGSRTLLSFPVLRSNQPWRTRLASRDVPGEVRELQIGELPNRKINATLLSLSRDFGETTAGVAVISRNQTGSVVGCGCSVDMRWAQGQLTTYGSIGFRTWQGHFGHPGLPEANRYHPLSQELFSSKTVAPNLGATITADIELLRALTPHVETFDNAASPIDEVNNFTTLEMNLLSSRHFDQPWVLSEGDPTFEIESSLTAYFVNALSRVGYHLQLDFTNSPPNITSLLRKEIGDKETLLRNNGKVFSRPTNISTVPMRQEWYNYGTAWQLNDPALYLSIFILGLHLVIALVHTGITVGFKNTSESWDSIAELIALAFNSSPQNALENCGAGIRLRSTLKQRVKVMAVDKESGAGENVELVFCDQNVVGHGGDASDQESHRDIQEGKEYG